GGRPHGRGRGRLPDDVPLPDGHADLGSPLPGPEGDGVSASFSAGSVARRRRAVLDRLLVYVPLGLITLFLLAPFYWMVITALKPDSELYSATASPLFVQRPTLVHFDELFSKTAFFTWTRNSFVVSTASTAIALLFGVPAGYAMARLRFRGRNALGLAIFATYLIPGTLLFIPMHQIVNR